MAKKCEHPNKASLYRRGPEKEGGKFIPDAYRCRDCGALLER